MEGPDPKRELAGFQSVNLLISILIRYPEISTIKYTEEDAALKFTFMLKPDAVFDRSAVERRICESLRAHADLIGERPKLLQLTYKNYDEVTLLELRRDIKSLTQPEIALLIGLVREELGEALIMEAAEPLLPEENEMQEQMIETLLEGMRQLPQQEHSAYGLREDGHVLVFNKPPSAEAK